MFVMVDERLAWWKVTFRGVADDGSVVDHEIELRFRVLDEEEFPAFVQKFTIAAPAADVVTTAAALARWEAVVKLLLDVVRDWRGVAAANGEPLAFSAENFRRLMKVPLVLDATSNAYLACRRAAPEVREGN